MTDGLRPVAVLTQPDRPAGRGRVLAAGPVKALARSLDIPVLQPQGLKEPGIQHQLAALSPDLIVVVAYGLLLPRAVLALPRRGCVNVHASLLPRWRGASPIQAAILAGDTETGVSIMALEAGLDTGPVYGAARVVIGPTETAGQLEERLGTLGAATLAALLPGILAGSLVAVPQPVAGATHAARMNKSDALIDWSWPAERIARSIRAYNPWPIAETRLGGRQLRCYEAVALGADPPASDRPPGRILAAGNEGIQVQTGAGTLRLLTVQLPGKPRMGAADLARGRAVVGQQLGAQLGAQPGEQPGQQPGG